MLDELSTFLFVFFAYLLGSFPTGKLVAALKKIDIQKVGSGNTGATNISRALGFRYALLVAVVDVAKSFIPTLVALHFWDVNIALLVGMAASLGHAFSFFLKFRGGKAVSTYIGSLLALAPLETAIWIAFWFVAIKYMNLMSVVNLVMLLIFVPILFFLKGSEYAAYAFIMWIFIVFMHRENIRRLREGKELPIVHTTMREK